MTSETDFSNKYNAEIEIAGCMIAGRLRALGISGVIVSPGGVADFESPLAEIRDSVLKDRREAGYELSYSQLCHSFYHANKLLNPKQ